MEDERDLLKFSCWRYQINQVVTYSLNLPSPVSFISRNKNHCLSTYITSYSCLYHYLNTFINHCRNERNKSVDALAYGIYMAAAFHKSQQPNRNLHFSPSNPHTKKIGKKWNTNSKVKKKKRSRKNGTKKKKGNQTHLNSLSYTKPCFSQSFIRIKANAK